MFSTVPSFRMIQPSWSILYANVDENDRGSAGRIVINVDSCYPVDGSRHDYPAHDNISISSKTWLVIRDLTGDAGTNIDSPPIYHPSKSDFPTVNRSFTSTYDTFHGSCHLLPTGKILSCPMFFYKPWNVSTKLLARQPRDSLFLIEAKLTVSARRGAERRGRLSANNFIPTVCSRRRMSSPC